MCVRESDRETESQRDKVSGFVSRNVGVQYVSAFIPFNEDPLAYLAPGFVASYFPCLVSVLFGAISIEAILPSVDLPPYIFQAFLVSLNHDTIL